VIAAGTRFCGSVLSLVKQCCAFSSHSIPFDENRGCDFAGTQCGWYFVGRMRCDDGNVKEGGT